MLQSDFRLDVQRQAWQDGISGRTVRPIWRQHPHKAGLHEGLLRSLPATMHRP